MVKMIVDADALKLTVDDTGIVWYLHGEGMPHCSDLSDWDFLQSPILQNVKQVRMVGSSNNAELLHKLYELKLKQELNSLQVCSPMCCDIADNRNDPGVVLFKMRNYKLAPSLGGWHEFGRGDFPSYLLAAYYKRHNKAADYTKQATLSHVAWPALSFIENLNIEAVGKLFAALIDPRWFVDVADIDSGVRLQQFLGLNPRSVSATESSVKDPRVERCQLVLSCWKTTPDGSITPATSIPRNFLWRLWANTGGGCRGDLAASKFFVEFLRLTWTKAVCCTVQANHLFVPKFFFDQKDEIEAYEEYEKTFKTQGMLGENP